MSQYQKLLEDLESRRCEPCQGSGEIDDAEPGDISYRTWQCRACKGTGLKAEYQLTRLD